MARIKNTSFCAKLAEKLTSVLVLLRSHTRLISMNRLTASALVFLLSIQVFGAIFAPIFIKPVFAQEVLLDSGASSVSGISTLTPNTDIPSVPSPADQVVGMQPDFGISQKQDNNSTNTIKSGDINSIDNAVDSGTFKTNIKDKNDSSKTPGVDSKTPQTAASLMSPTGTVISPDYFSQPQAQNKMTPKVDNNTGALTYNYTFNLPPGRGASSPSLGLNYNNQNAEDGSIFGYGWSLSLPYIERINKTGLNNLYSSNTYSSSIHGELVNTTSSNYVPKVQDGTFVNYVLASGFSMRDSTGTEYVFGDTSSSQLSNSNNTKIYRWLISKITDVNGNTTTFTYIKDSNQIYPDKISYTSRTGESAVFEVYFSYELRPDPILSYKTGFDVKTLKRTSQILIKQSGTLLHKYDFTYTAGSNTARSLLASVIETGYDESGVATTLPATNFEYSSASTGWNYQPSSLIAPLNPDYGDPVRINKPESQLIDLNGDSYPDLWQSFRDTPNVTSKNKIYFSDTNNTWVLSTLTPPVLMNDYETRYATGGVWDQGDRIADVNGDGYLDVIQSADQSTGIYNIYFNNQGASFTGQLSNPTTLGFTELSGANQGSTVDYRARTMELNGDGLVDIYSNCFTSCNFNYQVKGQQFANGAGYGSVTQTWNMPTINNGISDYFYGPHPDRSREFDINGDGLTDIVSSYTAQPYWNIWNQHSFINKGDGAWNDLPQYYSPLPFFIANASSQLLIMPVDINNDGLVDYVVDPKDGGYWTDGDNIQHQIGTYLNTGNGFVRSASFDLPNADTSNSVAGQFSETGIFADVNADGLQDIVYGGAQNGANYYYKVLYRTGEKPDQLKKITLPEGGYTSVTYKSSANYRNSSNQILNPNLPFTVSTVAQITNNDGLGTVQTFSYSYEGGKYYFGSSTDKKFAGFAKVKITDAIGNTTATFYHQGDSSNSALGEYQDESYKIGKPYRIEQADSNGNNYLVTINKWDSFDLGNNSKFVKLIQTVEQTFDGNATHKDKAEGYSYNDGTGNLITRTTYGEVNSSNDGIFTDVGSDKITTDYSYATGSSLGVSSLPSSVTVTNQSAIKQAEQKFSYDNLPWGGIDKGNLTKTETWKTGTSYITTTKTYNSYGLVTDETDGRGKNTHYTFDSLNLYPITITNALNQSTQFIYDYTLGKPKQVTDVNGLVFQTIYDGLDRVILEKQPDVSTPATLVNKTSYTYTSLPVGTKLQKTDYLDNSNSVDSYSYTDGFGRVVQTRVEQETANQFAVTDTIYNNLGQIYKTSLPYASTGLSKTSATTDANILVTFSYDAIGRQVSQTDILGSTITSYDDWKTIITDARGKSKNLYKDAYNRLIKVDELNNSAVSITSYDYDSSGNLVKITDALGNIRNFVYDGAGRRTYVEDLHAVADTSFGVYYYTYDDNGNATSITNPNGQIINSTFDDINRKLTEDYTGAAGVEVTNTYDACTYGIGKLCTSTNTGGSDALTYNPLGQVASKQTTIDGVQYLTTYSYDRQNNLLVEVNPDSSQFKYNYNTAGQLESTQRKESTDSTWQNVVTNFDYGIHGGLTIQVNNNGTTTTNTYDPTKLYRLIRKQTTSNGSGNPITTSFYSLAGDGSVYNSGTVWSTVHDASIGTVATYTTTPLYVRSGKNSATSYRIERGFLPFDTSAIPDTAIVQGAKLKLYVQSKLNHDNDGDDFITITQGSEPSTSVLTTADYSAAGSTTNPTEGIDIAERKDITAIPVAQSLTINLNATGRSWISKTGSTKLAVREGHDVVNSPFVGASSQYDEVRFATLEQAGVTNDPVLEVTYVDNTPLTIQDVNYTYDAVGNITQINDISSTSTAKVVNYTYDDLNRLSSSVTSSVASGQQSYNEAYTYDALGNIITKTSTIGSSPTQTSTYSYAGNAGSNFANPHAVTSISTLTSGNPTPVVVNYSYDNAGNLISENSDTYTWNYNNTLASSVVSGTSSSYTYNSSGLRTKQSTGSSFTRYPSGEYNVDNTGKVTKHLAAGSNLSLTIEGTGSSILLSYTHTDHLGSSSVSTSSTGQILETSDYYPYGNLRISLPYTSFSEQRKYIGKEYDTQTNLSYLNARYYKGSIGRFISEDPVFLSLGDANAIKPLTNQDQSVVLSDPQNFNSYTYGRSNPLRYSDPSGNIAIVSQMFRDFSQAGYAGSTFFESASNKWTWSDNPSAKIILGALADTSRQVATVYDGQASVKNRLWSAALFSSNFAGGEEAVFIKASPFEKTLIANQKSQIIKVSSNFEIQKLVNTLFKSTDEMTGGTAAAAKYEIQNPGFKIAGRNHIIKAEQSINRINNLLKKGDLFNFNKQDINFLKSIRKGLQNGLVGK